MATRYRYTAACVRVRKPLVSSSLLPLPHSHRNPQDPATAAWVGGGNAEPVGSCGAAAWQRDLSGCSAEVDAGDAGGGQAQRGASGVGEAGHSNTRSAIALSLLLSDAYQVSTSGEISTIQRGLSTGRVSHERYIAFTRYASDRLPDRRRRPARSWRQRQVPNRGSTGSARQAPGWSRAYVPIAHVAFTRHDAK